MYYHLSLRRLSPVSYGGYPHPAEITLLGINSATGMILLSRKEVRLFPPPHTAPGKTYSVLLRVAQDLDAVRFEGIRSRTDGALDLDPRSLDHLVDLLSVILVDT